MKLNTLLCLDSENIEKIRNLLLEEGLEIYTINEKGNFLEEISRGYLDIIFLDCSGKFLDVDIISTINNIKKLDPRLEIICCGLAKDAAVSIEAIKYGATACINFPFDHEQIRTTIMEIKGNANHRKEVFKIEIALHEKYIFAEMVSKNPVMLDIFNLTKRVSPYYRTILISGDTGTGKEVLARAIYNLSPASKEPFVVCNCAGMVETLIESELFGHIKGAFTGAISDKKGLFEAAGSGTIFLDEIGDMPLSFQPHLLRVLQDGEFRPVGSTKTMKAKCRVIAATNVDLSLRVKNGEFREDLFFRLATITINLPPLIERKEDIPLLSRFFLDKLNKKIGKDVRGITMDAKRLFMSHNWPGNLRELENVIERAVLVSTVNFVRSQDLPPNIKEGAKTEQTSDLSLEETEKNHIKKVLLIAGGNKTKAAAMLCISRRALLRKTIKYNLQ